MLGEGGVPDLGRVFQNPIAAVGSALDGAASSAISAVTEAIGGNAFTSALGDLQTSLSALVAHADGMVGTSLLDVIGHANIADLMGSALPASLGLDKAIGPLAASDALGSIKAEVEGLADKVIAGTVSAGAAAAAISAHRGDLDAMVGDSTEAFGGLQDIAQAVASVLAVGGVVLGAKSSYAGIDPQLGEALRSVLRPDVLADLDREAAALFPPVPAMPIPGEG